MTDAIAIQSDSAGRSLWHSTLTAAASVDSLKASLADYAGGLDPGQLTKIVIVGAGPEGRRLADICKARDIALAAVVDDDPSTLGMKTSGAVVEPASRLADLDRDIPIVIASHRVLNASQRLHALGFWKVFPFAVLQVLRPDIFKPHMFYEGWLEDLFENRSQYTWLDGELADAKSHQLLAAVIQFRLTGDPLVLGPIIDKGRYYQGLYHPQGLFELESNEVYIDTGAYDGDSINWFKERVNDRYDRVVAIEPDPVTYARLAKNFACESRIEPLNAGLHRAKATLHFRDDASRGATFSDDAEASIERLRLYLRQHDGGVIETVLYALSSRHAAGAR